LEFVKDTGHSPGNSKTRRRKALFICRYKDCNKEKELCVANVRPKNTITCGCFLKERISDTHLDDLTNQRFGRLVVKERTKNAKDGQTRWVCICDCGKVKPVRAGKLKNKETQSCGCLRKEITRARNPPIEEYLYYQFAASRFGKCIVPGKTSKSKALWECCLFHRWSTSFSSIVQNDSWCPTCAGSKHNGFENEVFHGLWYYFPDAQRNIKGLLKNKRFELDIWIPSLRAGIECDGEKWHAYPKAIERDARKNKECAEAGIKLLRIKYLDWKKDQFSVIVRIIEFLTE